MPCPLPSWALFSWDDSSAKIEAVHAEARNRTSERESWAGCACRSRNRWADETEIEMSRGESAGSSLETLFEGSSREHIIYLDSLVLLFTSVCHFSSYFRSVTQFIVFIDEIFALPSDTYQRAASSIFGRCLSRRMGLITACPLIKGLFHKVHKPLKLEPISGAPNVIIL